MEGDTLVYRPPSLSLIITTEIHFDFYWIIKQKLYVNMIHFVWINLENGGGYTRIAAQHDVYKSHIDKFGKTFSWIYIQIKIANF